MQEGEGSEGQGDQPWYRQVLKPTGAILAEPDGNAGTYTAETINRTAWRTFSVEWTSDPNRFQRGMATQ